MDSEIIRIQEMVIDLIDENPGIAGELSKVRDALDELGERFGVSDYADYQQALEHE